MLTGTVFDIQRCCVHDGPGIRTTVFLKGCSLQCFWCHNPESINPNKQLMVFLDKCIHCHYCIEVCKQKAHILKNGEHIFDRSLCNACGECVKGCESKALTMSGTTMTVEQVMEEVLKDISFYKTSKGGVTFSGGEPLLQIDFLEELLLTCKQNNLHTAIETAGNTNWESFERIAPYTDLFLYDLKIMNPDLHKQVTGMANRRCLSNLKQLIEKGKEVRVRIPVIPGINDFETAIKEIVDFVTSLDKKTTIELMPFHKMGQSKYDSLGLTYKAQDLNAPSQEVIQQLQNIISFEMKN